MKPLHLRADPIPLSGTLLPPLTFIVSATSVLTGFLRTRAHTHLLAGPPRAVAEGVRRKPFGRRRRCGFYPGDTQGALMFF